MRNLKIQLFIIVILVSFSTWLVHNHLIINMTSSIPRGLYFQKQKINIGKGDIVAVCLPEELRLFALNRHYISRGIYCQGTTPLIKEIIAIPNDTVEVTDHAIEINNKLYPIKKFNTDGRGRALSSYPNGTYHANGFWLLGTYHERSWDSRYFGEIQSSCILCVLRPIFIW